MRVPARNNGEAVCISSGRTSGRLFGQPAISKLPTRQWQWAMGIASNCRLVLKWQRRRSISPLFCPPEPGTATPQRPLSRCTVWRVAGFAGDYAGHRAHAPVIYRSAIARHCFSFFSSLSFVVRYLIFIARFYSERSRPRKIFFKFGWRMNVCDFIIREKIFQKVV